MESSSEAERIHLSDAAFAELQAEKTKLVLEARGKIDVKGKGVFPTWCYNNKSLQVIGRAQTSAAYTHTHTRTHAHTPCSPLLPLVINHL